MFLFNCILLAFDITVGWERKGRWISQNFNQICDGLARSAVLHNSIFVEVIGEFVVYESQWKHIVQ